MSRRNRIPKLSREQAIANEKLYAFLDGKHLHQKYKYYSDKMTIYYVYCIDIIEIEYVKQFKDGWDSVG